jgi:hypothetical protein
MQLADVKFITEAAQATHIAAQRYEIMFKDGTSIGLHQVWVNGAPVRLLRALRQGDLFLVFDLGKLSPQLARELPPSPDRDVVGMIFFTLRQGFKTANDCVQAIHAVHRKAVPADAMLTQLPTLPEAA